MSTFRPPLLLQTYPEKQKLVICLVILGLCLLSLFYIIGSSAWLPFMGRPFAQAYRTIKNQKSNQAGLEKAIASIHNALNTTAQFSIFNHNVKAFCLANPNFNFVQDEIIKFFNLSNEVFFNTHQQSDLYKTHLLWLKSFCRQCRDCERGLKPSLKSVIK
jgi:mxaA protein